MSARLTCALALWALLGCDDPKEAGRVELPVIVDGARLSGQSTDLGYEITLTEAQIALRDLAFTIAGEAHVASLWRIFPAAYAHPGHFQGGEVTGELKGRFIIDWIAEEGRELGVATLLEGEYDAFNFTFDHAAEGSLRDHTARLSGIAAREGAEVRFSITLDAPEGRALIGAPFETHVAGGMGGSVRLQLQLRDDLEGDCLFDGIDLLALDADGDGQLEITPDDPLLEDAYNAIRRRLLTHDHYNARHQEQSP